MRVLSPARVTSRICPQFRARMPANGEGPSTFANEIGYADLLSGVRTIAPLHRRYPHILFYRRELHSSTLHHAKRRQPNNHLAATPSLKAANATSNEPRQPLESANDDATESFGEDWRRSVESCDSLKDADHDTLCFESGVKVESTFDRPRLIDMPSYTFDYRLWSDLLEFRSRRDGTIGVKHVWREMIERTGYISTSSDLVDKIWRTILNFAVQDQAFLKEIIAVEKAAMFTRPPWRHLYDHIISYMLKTTRKTRRQEVLRWHHQLSFTSSFERSTDGIIDCVITYPTALRILSTICKSKNAPKLHDTLIPRLCEEEKFADAAIWHRYLIKHGDLPTNTLIIEPLQRYLVSGGFQDEVQAINRGMASAGIPVINHIPEATSTLARAESQAVIQDNDDFYDIEGSYTGDRFLSRLFATKAFGLHLLINAVAAFGSQRLGPLAMQQIALRCENTTELKETLGLADINGIEIEPHAYSRVLQVVASSRYEILFDSIKSSDMHPDAFEDTDTQKRLLRYYISQKKLLDVHRTLLVLGEHRGEQSEPYSNNLLMAYVILDGRTEALELLDDILYSGNTLTESTQRELEQLLLFDNKNPTRDRHRAEVQSEDLDFLLKILVRILQAGREVIPQVWGSVLRRCCLLARQADLEYLAVFAASHYSSHLSADTSTLPSNKQSSRLRSISNQLQVRDVYHPLSVVFTPDVVRAIIESSFTNLGRPFKTRSALPFAMQTEEATKLSDVLVKVPLYARGLALVKWLYDRYKVYVNIHGVRKVIMHRFTQLYGKGRSKLPHNRLARFKNRTEMGSMARELNEIWDGKLFDLPKTLLQGEDEASRAGLAAALIGIEHVSSNEGFTLRKVVPKSPAYWLMRTKKYRRRLYANRETERRWANSHKTDD